VENASATARRLAVSFVEDSRSTENGQASTESSDGRKPNQAYASSRSGHSIFSQNSKGHRFHTNLKHMKKTRTIGDLSVVKHIWDGDWKLREPKRSGILASVARSKRFKGLCAFVIFLNAICAIAGANVAVQGGDTGVFKVLEDMFFGFYLLELTLKLLVHRMYFFVGKDAGHNSLDLLIVSIDGLGILLNSLTSTRVIDFSFLRSLRIFKVTRMLRVLRAFEHFNDLRVLLEAMAGSLLSLVGPASSATRVRSARRA